MSRSGQPAKPRPTLESRLRVLPALAVLPLLGALAGCGVSATDLPLPGGGVEGPTYRLTAVFADALNLPDGAHVKLNGDDIGRVQNIAAKDYTAQVAMAVRQDVRLPRSTTAELRQETPLGEVFVAMQPPTPTIAGPPLHDGDTIGLASTTAAATVEDLLAALSTLVNGGGLAQLQTIVHELNAATDARADQIAHLLGQTTQTMATLNARTQDIDRALAATQRLTDTLIQRRDTIDKAFADFTPAIRLLADKTDLLTRALNSIGRLSDRGDDLIDTSGSDIRDLARDLGPVLDGFARIGPNLAPSLRNVVEFGKVIESISKGESAVANGKINLATVVAAPQPGDTLAGPNDLVQGGQSLIQHLEHQLSTLGGTR